MSSVWGDRIKISVFGESHGEAIGVVIDGLPAGERLDLDKILLQMSRRAPGRDITATPRLESDLPKLLSGFNNGCTTGAPLCAVIENTNTRSGDYADLALRPRPGHSDYTAFVKYGGFNDVRGGGHFSGRLTAPLVFAGAVCRQMLERQGIIIAAHIASIGKIKDKSFDAVNPDKLILERLSQSAFPLIDASLEGSMREEVACALAEQDSVGGTVECIAVGLPAGLGGPLFGGVEGLISSAVFAVPAVKGIEFGKGFAFSEMKGSQSNDPYELENGNVVTKTNNCGGILGGITDGMPLLFKAAIKPTPSIGAKQDTVDLHTMQSCSLEIKGRHDPCIVPRAVPVIESVTAVALANLIRW